MLASSIRALAPAVVLLFSTGMCLQNFISDECLDFSQVLYDELLGKIENVEGFLIKKFECILSLRSLKNFSIIFGFRKPKFKLLLSIYFILILSFSNNYVYIKYVKNTLILKILKVFSLLIYLELYEICHL